MATAGGSEKLVLKSNCYWYSLLGNISVVEVQATTSGIVWRTFHLLTLQMLLLCFFGELIRCLGSSCYWCGSLENPELIRYWGSSFYWRGFQRNHQVIKFRLLSVLSFEEHIRCRDLRCYRCGSLENVSGGKDQAAIGMIFLRNN